MGKVIAVLVLLAAIAPVASAAAADRVLVANVPRGLAQAQRVGVPPATERMRIGLALAHPRPDALQLRERARDVGDEDAVVGGRGSARHRDESGEQHEDADDLSHAHGNAPEVGNLLGLRAR